MVTSQEACESLPGPYGGVSTSEELPLKHGDKRPRKYGRNIAKKWRASTLYFAYATTTGRRMHSLRPSIPSGAGYTTGSRELAKTTTTTRTTAVIATTVTTTPVTGPMDPQERRPGLRLYWTTILISPCLSPKLTEVCFSSQTPQMLTTLQIHLDPIQMHGV